LIVEELEVTGRQHLDSLFFLLLFRFVRLFFLFEQDA
jgi:hypothetical protein